MSTAEYLLTFAIVAAVVALVAGAWIETRRRGR